MHTPKSLLEALTVEHNELTSRLDSLRNFLSMEEFSHLDAEQQSLLHQQSIAMSHYLAVLTKRVDLATKPKTMTYGEAVELAKQGHAIARTGWNGQNMLAFLVDPQQMNLFEHHIKIRPHWLLFTSQKDLASWVPSGYDALASDWVTYTPEQAKAIIDEQVLSQN